MRQVPRSWGRTRSLRRRLLQGFGLAFAVGVGLASSVAIGSASTQATTTASTSTKSSIVTTTKVVAPSNTSLPTISGTAQDGALLTANPGEWTGSPSSYGYQWLRCDADGANCAPIAGANSQRYTLGSADVGHRVRIRVTATNSAGSGTATSRPTDVVKATGSAPANTAAPTISGTPQQGETLTVSNGTWTGTQPISYDYSWQRCDGGGGNCSTFISHSSLAKYTLTSTDVGHTIRAQVTAKNARGSSTATSQQTGLVAPAKQVQGSTTLAVSQVSLPDRLVIDGVRFSPNPVRSRRSAIVARFHVSDTRGFSIQGALVYALGLPYGWTFNAAEQPTNSSGWATLIIHPTPNMPLRRGDLVMFIRARKPGDNLLAGVSTRRLVQEGIARP
jgi:hypothetical protein